MSEPYIIVPVPEIELPLANASGHPPGRMGMWTLIATEAGLFGFLLFSYFYLVLQSNEDWPPEGLPDLFFAGSNTVILLSSSVFVWGCEKLLEKRRRGWSMFSMLVAIGLGAAFIGIQLLEWSRKTFTISSELYGSLYFTITGFHMAHVTVGLVMLTLLLLQLRLGYFTPERRGGLPIIGLYWHFVDIVWLFIFSSLYLSPYLLRGIQ